jgi:hypothetical protein
MDSTQRTGLLKENMEPKIIIIVGRSETEDRFRALIARTLPEGFVIEGVHSLGEYYESDGKDRFIAFVSCDNEELFNESFDAIYRKTTANSFGASSFDNISEAFEYATDEYNFLADDDEREARYEEMREKFPLFSAEEWEQIQIFDSLYVTGKVKPIRARYNDETIVVLAHITGGADEVRVTPMMILITDDIHEELEIPFAP